MSSICLLLLWMPVVLSGSPILSETDNFLIIHDPADLEARLSEVRALLYVDDQGNDNPQPAIIPTTVAFYPSDQPYQIGTLKLGYLTAVLGLGVTPDDVTLTGEILVAEGLNSVDNVFFKSVQNLHLDGNLTWPVAQACPLRNVHIGGSVNLVDGCGGFVADSVIDGELLGGGQQQFLFRNVTAGSPVTGRPNGQMNFVFLDSPTGFDRSYSLCSGVESCGMHYPTRANMAPSVNLFTHDLPHDVSRFWKPVETRVGLIHPDGFTSNEEIYQVRSQSDLDTLVPHIDLTVLVYPGVYFIKRTLYIIEGMSVIGLGFPIFRSMLSGPTVVLGNRGLLASVIVDAPLLTYDQDVMIDVPGKKAQLYDVFTRTFLAWYSPPQAMKTNTMLRVTGDGAFMENIWLWRGDHWTGPDLEDNSFANPTWDPLNINPYGLYVTGSAVTCLGCFVEHQLWNPIVWDGDDGLLVMSQGETAYTNNGVIDPDVAGNSTKHLPLTLTPGIYYSIGEHVTSHTFLGGGVYNIFGEMFSKGFYPAMEVHAASMDQIDVTTCLVAGWVSSPHFSSVLRYNNTDYGPAMTGDSESFYICDLRKFIGGQGECASQ